MKTAVITVVAVSLFSSFALAQELDGTLKKVNETGTLSIGFQENSVPFSYLGDNQQPIGFSLDICARVVDAVKKKLNRDDIRLRWVPVTGTNRIPLLLNGTIDIQCASATNSEERRRQVDFTNTHFLSANSILARKDRNIKTIDDLKGLNVVSLAGSTNVIQLAAVNRERKLGINVLTAKDHFEAFLMIDTGRADAYVMDDIALVVVAARSKDPSSYALGEEQLALPQPMGIMVRKKDPQFKELVDETTAELFRSPEITQLYHKWFESPVPPGSWNFNFAMPAALKHAYENPKNDYDPQAYVVN